MLWIISLKIVNLRKSNYNQKFNETIKNVHNFKNLLKN